jgi:formylglycine-generating enzyme required for sulfatase activity
MNQAQSTYNTAAIRRLLLSAFSDEEFTIFCYDHFRQVYQTFATGISFPLKVQALIDHCERHNAFPELLPFVEEAHPTKYAEFISSLQKPEPQTPTPHTSTPGPRPLSSIRQPFEPEMILIPAGEFLMGSDPLIDEDADDDEQPQHLLYLPDYYLAKTPVTNAQFRAFIRATDYQTVAEHKSWSNVWAGQWRKINGTDWQHPHGPESSIDGKDYHPVVQISYQDAIAYCNWLAEVTSRQYRLPSEAEWEKGARGSDGRIYPWGNDWEVGWCNSVESGSGDSMPVGAYPVGESPYGLLDMAGNVWEWTRSLWGKELNKPDFRYPYRPGDGRENVRAGNDILRVLRGGSWGSNGDVARCAFRYWDLPDFRCNNVGFRVAISPF